MRRLTLIERVEVFRRQCVNLGIMFSWHDEKPAPPAQRYVMSRPVEGWRHGFNDLREAETFLRGYGAARGIIDTTAAPLLYQCGADNCESGTGTIGRMVITGWVGDDPYKAERVGTVLPVMLCQQCADDAIEEWSEAVGQVWEFQPLGQAAREE